MRRKETPNKFDAPLRGALMELVDRRWPNHCRGGRPSRVRRDGRGCADVLDKAGRTRVVAPHLSQRSGRTLFVDASNTR